MNHTTPNFRTPMALAVVLALTACAATIDDGGLEQRTSMAIGREVGTFTLSDRSEESGGRINYVARTKDGAVYKCYLYSPSGFQRAMTFGMTPNSDALCTRFGTSGAAAPVPSGTCNALLKAAGRC
ncbi:hypothetical protein [Hydrogenophaga sp. NFH-34]|uniref:hypothetical protein n=1 Tax=Hydrogenophaga sp. NFH-34 TaxID=2744446 RepID=UPI001F20BE4C|nr:hypothetical protein [Hydrogenophaga sp. NFH-34]